MLYWNFLPFPFYRYFFVTRKDRRNMYEALCRRFYLHYDAAIFYSNNVNTIDI